MIGVWIGSGLCSVLLAAATLAAPPAARNGILTRTNDAGPQRSSAGAPSRLEAPRLDLRPPDFRAMPAFSSLREAAAGAPSGEAPFPSSHRAGTLEDDGRPETQSRDLGATGLRMTEESAAQQMARRFHREGLPLARLWQSHSALLSLGLNQRGKPGLWLTQKIP